MEETRKPQSAEPGSGPPPVQAPQVPPDIDEADCVARYFDGDRDIYDSYKALCRTQFSLDIQTGDNACAATDGLALRHLTHSLKAVLLSLGYAQLSEAAGRMEQAAENGDMAGALAQWPAFRARFAPLAS